MFISIFALIYSGHKKWGHSKEVSGAKKENSRCCIKTIGFDTEI